MKQLYRPLKPFVKGQRFGENKACIEIGGTKVISCDGKNPPKGYKSVYGSEGHTGLDLAAYARQPIMCARKGTVRSIDTNTRTGLDVRIETEVDGVRYRHVYEHLDAYNVRVGQDVETGELIGWAGTTGKSSGVHLHFGVYELQGDKWVPVDPEPLLYDGYAEDYLYYLNWVKWALQYLKK